ncbi:hypothetical protein H8356DRAFT_1388341 [Neocallimastix lanati (nom. inval.)]|nr:hypothetical protein H8356DRAFT_1388341 [Neocallimastix sp. JGI-2020a]
MIENSNEMLEVTLNKNVKRMCKILDKSLLKEISPGNKINNINLKSAIYYSYFHARTKYNIVEEDPKGKRKVDFILYPKGENNVNGEIIIVELRVNGKYSCIIEEYDNDKNVLSSSLSEVKKKRRNETEIDGIYKKFEK